jgi:membrane-bound lytic murein transglycosylase D
MNKRLLLLGIFILGLGWLSALRADDDLRGKRTKTLVKPHSFKGFPGNLSKNQSPAEFRDLFIGNATGESNGARLNPKAINFVQDYVEKNSKDLLSMKIWGRPYFNLIDRILIQYGLPRELKYMAVIESNLKAHSTSWAGAVGPWQLMPTTARLLGLKVNHRYDERTNYTKSTRAAAIYLRDLYNELGDWLLVMAAYNGGTGHVYYAINKSHSRNFWNLQYYLPQESREYVKKFIGTHYIFEGQGGVTTLTNDEAIAQLSGSTMYVFDRKLSKQELDHSRSVPVSGKYYAATIAKYTLMDLSDFNRYNPDFDKVMASSNNTYDLRLPEDKIDLFAANKYEILNESLQSLASELVPEYGLERNSRDIAKNNVKRENR